MALRISCPSCQATFSLSEALRGKKIRCQQCDKMLAVPDSTSKVAPEGNGAGNPVMWIAAGGAILLLLAGVLVLVLVMRSGDTTKTDDVQLVVQNTTTNIETKSNDPIEKASDQDPAKNLNPASQDPKNPEPVKNPEPAKDPEPVKDREPIKIPDPAKDPEPIKNPEPVKNPEPAKDPEPVKTPEPAKDPVAKPNPEPDPVVPVAGMSAEKIYQRLLKSTVFIVSTTKTVVASNPEPGGNQGKPNGGQNQGAFPFQGGNQGLPFPGGQFPPQGFPGQFPPQGFPGGQFPPKGFPGGPGGNPQPPGGLFPGGGPMPGGGQPPGGPGGNPQQPGGLFPGGGQGPGGGQPPGGPGGNPQQPGGGLFPGGGQGPGGAPMPGGLPPGGPGGNPQPPGGGLFPGGGQPPPGPGGNPPPGGGLFPGGGQGPGGGPMPGGGLFPGGGKNEGGKTDASTTATVVTTGSGSLVDRKHRLIVTNVHVVGDNPTVTIYFPEFDAKGDLIGNRDEYKKKPGLTGKVVAREARCDLALVQVESLPAQAQPLAIAKNKVMPAQQVHTVGNTGSSGSLWSYSPGKVRQVFPDKWSVTDKTEGKTQNYDAIKIETDSAINPGDSGGPLVNDRGSLVGVVHGGNVAAQNVSIFIECSEVRALVEKYFKSIEETWVPEPEPFVRTIPVAQITEWIKNLSHDDMGQRVKAAQVLGSMGPEGTIAFAPLFNALRDREAPVRHSVADALESVPPHKDDAPMLIKVCQDKAEPAAVRLQALTALSRLGEHAKSAMPALLALAGGSQEDLRKTSLFAALVIGPETGDLPSLLNLLSSSNPDTRRKTCVMIGKMKEQAQPAAKELAALLKDKDQDVAIQAARALVKIGDAKAALTFLTANVKQGKVEQRKECIIGLGDLGPDAKPAVKELIPLFDDDALRPLVQEAVIKIGKAAVPSLTTKLTAMVKNSKTTSANARLACIICLREINHVTNEVGNALGVAAYYDPVPENRNVAGQAGIKMFNVKTGKDAGGK